MATGYQPPNNAMKLTRGGLEANRGMVTAGRHGLAATRDQGSRVRPSQLIASVRWTNRRNTGVGGAEETAKSTGQKKVGGIGPILAGGGPNNLRQMGDGKRPKHTDRSRGGGRPERAHIAASESERTGAPRPATD